MRSRMHILTGVCCLVSLTSAASLHAALKVEATLSPRSISTDEAAVLTITAQGSEQTKIEMPEVDGLQLRPQGTSSSMQITNGKVTSSVTQTLLVWAGEPGEFTIPKIRVTAGNEEAFTAEPLVLKVAKGTGRARPSHPRRASPAQRPPGISSQPGATAMAGKPGDIAFLEVVPAKTEVVVGEFIPVEVRAYFRAGERVSLRSLPGVNGTAFIMKNQEGDARQERVSIGGTPYTKLTFFAGIAAVKPGDFPAEVTLDATVVVRERSGRDNNNNNNNNNPTGRLRSRMGSLFDDPFFGDDIFDDFFSRLVEREVNLVADPVTIAVSETPPGEKPEGFTGAVGRFSVSASASTHNIEAGDPVTLKVQVEGEGNFDRVHMPAFSDTKGWKVYPANHEFVAADAIGLSGVKIFERVVIPLSPNVSEIPALEFSFYNPETGAYETTRTKPIAIKVTGDAIDEPAAGAASALSHPGGSERAIDHGSVDATGPPLVAVTPLYARPWFLTILAASLLVILSGSIALLIQCRCAKNPRRTSRKEWEREIAQADAEMDRAIVDNDTIAFFDSLRTTLRKYSGRALDIGPLAAVTAPGAKDDAVQEMIEAADAMAFSGSPVPATELRSWKEKTLRLIQPR